MTNYSKINIEYRKINNGFLFNNGIGLNELAFSIWDMCDGKNFEQIYNQVCSIYSPESEEEKELIHNDVSTCISDLIEAQLIAENK